MRHLKLAPALLLSASAAVSAFLMGGCVDNRASMYVDHVVGFDPEEGTCTGDSGLTIGTGSWDPLYGGEYIARIIVGNQLAPLGDNDTLRPETSRIALRGAEVSIEAPNGSLALPSFTTNFAGTVHPVDSENPGFQSVSVPLIPAGAASVLSPGTTYNVRFKVFGETLAGTDIETGDFIFPVRVTAPGALMRCNRASDLEDSNALHPCGYLAQDDFIFPCLDENNNVLQTSGCQTRCTP